MIADLLQILAALVFSALLKIPVMVSSSLRCSFALDPSGLPVSPTQTRSQFLHGILSYLVDKQYVIFGCE